MEEKKREHRITVSMRKSCVMSGIRDVYSFDEQEVVLDTELGGIIINGTELHVTLLSLETGEVSLDGQIDSVKYTDGTFKKTGESLWKRIWK